MKYVQCFYFVKHHETQFRKELTHTQTETLIGCHTNTQAHQTQGYNRFLTWIGVDMFLFPGLKLFSNSEMNWMEILRHWLVRATHLPRSIGQSCSWTQHQSTGADSSANRARSNSLICKGPDSRHKLTWGCKIEHLFPSQITFTVHRRRGGHIFWKCATVIKSGLCLYSAHASVEDLSPWCW